MAGLKSPMFIDRLTQYFYLTRLHKPIGIYLLLWPTAWALWLAGAGRPDMGIVLIFVLGVVLMRSAGCVINDYADRHFDGRVERTRERPLATGKVSPKEALWLFAVLCLAAFALVLLLNALTIGLSFAALLLATAYPFMKRYTHFPQVFLGAAFSWAIPMAFAAQTGAVPLLAWWLFGTALLWTVAYDTQYAMVDRADDMKIGIKSTAIWFGVADRWAIGALQAAVLLSLWGIGWRLGFGLSYHLGLLVAAGLALYQYYLIKDREPARCFQAFLNNHWLGLAVFVGLLLEYGLSPGNTS